MRVDRLSIHHQSSLAIDQDVIFMPLRICNCRYAIAILEMHCSLKQELEKKTVHNRRKSLYTKIEMHKITFEHGEKESARAKKKCTRVNRQTN